jgi:Flp pilus assembly protein CpaB
MSPKALIPLVAGLGIAGLAAKLGFDYIKKAEGKQTQMVQVWTPIQDIKRGSAIQETMIKPLAFPSTALPPGVLKDKEKIVGRVPHTGAPAGVPILDTMLLPPGTRPGVLVPPGMRAVAVKVDESSGVDNHLEPGCRVDVVGVFSVRKNNRKETIARTILQDVEVAAVGDLIAPPSPKANEKDDGKSKAPKRERAPGAVTLLVKPEQVPTLHLAEQKGKIKLCMLGMQADGDEPVNSSGTSAGQIDEQGLLGIEKAAEQGGEAEKTWAERMNEFVGTLWKKNEPAAAPAPEPLPEPPVQAGPQLAWTIVVWNGSERQEWGFRNMNDFQPILLSMDAPNIFQDDTKPPPPNPR